MNIFRPRRTFARTSSRESRFFVDSVGDPTSLPPDANDRRISDVVTFSIALATAVGAVGLLGLLQMWPA